MFTFINMYRRAIKETADEKDYLSTVGRIIFFPCMYVAYIILTVFFNFLDRFGKKEDQAEQKVAEYTNDKDQLVTEYESVRDGRKVHSKVVWGETVNLLDDPNNPQVQWLEKAVTKAVQEAKANGSARLDTSDMSAYRG